MALKKFALFFALATFAFGSPLELDDKKKPFTLEETALEKLKVLPLTSKWISDFELEYLDNESKDVKVFNAATNKSQIVLPSSVMAKYNTTCYEFSPDRKFVFLCYDIVYVQKHSKKAKYVVYSLEKKEYYDLEKKAEVQDAVWAPKGHTLVFIRFNDLKMVKDINKNMAKLDISTFGSSKFFCGLGDHINEEEILKNNRAFWFSPEGDQIMWACYFDTLTPRVIMPFYGWPGKSSQYPNHKDYYNPKPGTTNQFFELHRTNLVTGKTQKIAQSEYLHIFFHGFTWITEKTISYVVSDESTGKSITYFSEMKYTYDREVVSIMFQDENQKGVPNVFVPIFSKTGDRFLRLEPRNHGNNTYKHIVIYKNKEPFYALTGGEFEVLDVVHWNQDTKFIYYLATVETNPKETQVYAISEKKHSTPVCITCKIRTSEGRWCKDVEVKFSTNSSYFLASCKGPDPTIVYVFKNEHPYNQSIITLENNSKFRNELKKKLLPQVMNITVNIKENLQADVRLYLPPKFDPSGSIKYPFLLYVNARPESKEITEEYKFGFPHYVSSNLSVIYGIIDGRNTARKGENMLYAGFKALGTLEIDDQISVTNYLTYKFPFLDTSKMGVWGWGYGGFAATKILEMDKGLFKCGIAVSPIADLMNINQFFGHKYMRLPSENPVGYNKASVFNKEIENLRKKQYLLIHGTNDESVPYENSMMIARTLQEYNILFEFLMYADESHKLRYVRVHLYNEIDRFLKKCFDISQ